MVGQMQRYDRVARLRLTVWLLCLTPWPEIRQKSERRW